MRCEIPGDHNVINVAAAAAAAWAIGADPEALALAARSLRLPAGRYERRKIGDVELIYDAYNASPSGVAATLVSFSAEPARRKIVVLGSMAELGPEAPEMHRGAGALAATCGADALLFGGDFARELAAGARAAGFPEDRIVRFSDNDAAFTWLRARLRAGDLVLLKASRRYKLEEIVRELEAAHA
jgi:UDP-N-acetylmuramoyl-tripeptide--D-alanyl-D-alanine ligase